MLISSATTNINARISRVNAQCQVVLYVKLHIFVQPAVLVSFVLITLMDVQHAYLVALLKMKLCLFVFAQMQMTALISNFATESNTVLIVLTIVAIVIVMRFVLNVTKDLVVNIPLLEVFVTTVRRYAME